MTKPTAYKSYEVIVRQYLNLIKNNENCFSELRQILIYVYNKDYIKSNPKDLDLRKKKNKDTLLIYANEFLRNKLLTKATLLRRGWNVDLITEYLDNPDIIEFNPVKRVYMNLYSLCKIEKLETLDNVKPRLFSLDCDKQNDAEQIYKWIEDLEINIPEMPIEDLLKLSLDIYNKNIALTDADKRNLYSKAYMLEQLCLNYLRHECTNYSAYLKKLNWTDNGNLGYGKVKEIINKRIKDQYPNLKSCIYKLQREKGYI